MRLEPLRHVTAVLWISIVSAALVALRVTIPLIQSVIHFFFRHGSVSVTFPLLVIPLWVVGPITLLYCMLRERKVLRRSPGPLALFLNIWLIAASFSLVGFIYLVRLVSPSKAEAPEVKAALVNYGIFSGVEDASSIAPETTSGVSRTGKQGAMKEVTDRIPAKMGVRFGMECMIWGLPSGDVEITEIVSHPQITRPDGSVSKGFSTNKKFSPTLGMIRQIFGYGFDHDYELVSGEWKFELWYKNTKLIEKSFTVYFPNGK